MEYLRTEGSLQFIQNSSSSLCPSVTLLPRTPSLAKITGHRQLHPTLTPVLTWLALFLIAV